jgi:uncharacterized membrane protein
MMETLYLIMIVTTICIIAMMFIYPGLSNDTGYKLFAGSIVVMWIVTIFSIFAYLDRTMTKHDVISAVINIVAVLSALLSIIMCMYMKRGKQYITKIIVILLCLINVGIAVIIS